MTAAGNVPAVAYGQAVATGWWAGLAAGRVTRLTGADPDLVELSLEPLPPDAPAVVRFYPPPAQSLAQQVHLLLDELEEAAIRLFPRWLPGAEHLTGPRGNGVPAVRSLAVALAARTAHFGPFLAALAEDGLRGRRTTAGAFAAEVRAAGLGRVIAASYGRPTAALLIVVPAELSARSERILVSAGEWLAHHGGFAVWLTGSPLRTADRVDTAAVELTGPPADPLPEPVAPPGLIDDTPVLAYPAPVGFPHPASRAEKALEAALATYDWAAGRAWNQEYRSHLLAKTFRLDLMWAAEHCVVEVDGPDHYRAVKYADDRRRDTRLTLDGYTVLRFTNGQVLDDVHAVASQIHDLLRSRRPE